MIEIINLQKKYADVTPLENVNTTVNKGDVIALIGPSGCGKSTFLRCINMLDPPTGGKIIICGEEITKKGYDLNKLRLKVGMVFQSYELFNHLTAVENIMRPQMELLGKSKQEAYDKAYELLSLVGLSNRQFNFPDELSGGQKQRIAIARALAMEPEILLLDEPTSALDPAMVGEVETVIHNLARTGITMMLVTHDMNFARGVSNRMFYMDEGGIYEEGTPEQIFTNPKKEKTKAFIRSILMLVVKATSDDFDYPKAMADISRFGIRQGFDRKTISKLQIIFEELCTVYLKSDNQVVSALMELEHIEQTGEIKLVFKHNSDAKKSEDIENEMSFAIIRQYAKSYEQANIEDDLYKNEITLIVGKG